MKTIKEQDIHGNKMFGLETFSFDDYDCHANVYSHWHDELEILYLERGQTTCRVNGEVYEMSPGDIIFIYPGEIHEASSNKQARVSSHCIVFHPNLIQSMTYDSCQHRYVEPMLAHELMFPRLIKTNHPFYETLTPYILDIITLNESKPFGYELKIKSLLLLILSTCLMTVGEVKKPRRHQSTQNIADVKNAVDYIQKHYDQKIEITQIASLLNITNEHFCRIFKHYTNKRPIEYINDYRIEMAAKQLLLTDHSITDIALDTGYENACYFAKKFKQKKGMSPKVFRQTYVGQ